LNRSLKRHLRQDDLDIMLAHKNSPEAKRDIHIRQHLMERSFARGSRFGLKRARWRRLWRVEIQEYLTASIQNMMVLLNSTKQPKAALGRRVERPSVRSLLIHLNATACTIFNAFSYHSRRSVYSF
jgi:hypothetical protein